MDYQKSEEYLRPHLPNILVHTIDDVPNGYYHYHPINNLDDILFVEEVKGIPRFLLESLLHRALNRHKVAVCMQGASHRDTFWWLIRYLQKTGYEELWSWCSVKSGRIASYEDLLGFSYNPDIRYTFYNLNVGRDSTFRLGRWIK